MKKLLTLLILIILISTPAIVMALEVDFPAVGVDKIKPTDSFSPAQWINYIFLFGLAVVGLAIIYTLVRAGFLWMTAGGGNEGAVREARDRIKGAVVGLIILLGSVIFLNLINPNLTILKSPSIQIVGTWDYWKALFGEGSAAKFCTYFTTCKAGGVCLTKDGKEVTAGEFGLCAPGSELVGSGATCNTSASCTEKPGGKCLGSDIKEIGVDSSQQSGKCYYSPTTSFAPKSRKTGETCDKTEDCQSGTCSLPTGEEVKSGQKGFCSY